MRSTKATLDLLKQQKTELKQQIEEVQREEWQRLAKTIETGTATIETLDQEFGADCRQYLHYQDPKTKKSLFDLAQSAPNDSRAPLLSWLRGHQNMTRPVRIRKLFKLLEQFPASKIKLNTVLQEQFADGTFLINATQLETGFTPLQYACTKRDENLALFLLFQNNVDCKKCAEIGAEVYFRDEENRVVKFNRAERAPIMLACQFGLTQLLSTMFGIKSHLVTFVHYMGINTYPCKQRHTTEMTLDAFTLAAENHQWLCIPILINNAKKNPILAKLHKLKEQTPTIFTDRSYVDTPVHQLVKLIHETCIAYRYYHRPENFSAHDKLVDTLLNDLFMLTSHPGVTLESMYSRLHVHFMSVPVVKKTKSFEYRLMTALLNNETYCKANEIDTTQLDKDAKPKYLYREFCEQLTKRQLSVSPR